MQPCQCFVAQVLNLLIGGKFNSHVSFPTCAFSVFSILYHSNTVYSSHTCWGSSASGLHPAAKILLRPTHAQSPPSLQPLWLSGRPESFTWEAVSPPPPPAVSIPHSPTFKRDLMENQSFLKAQIILPTLEKSLFWDFFFFVRWCLFICRHC